MQRAAPMIRNYNQAIPKQNTKAYPVAYGMTRYNFSKKQEIVVKHKEYLGDVNALSGGFGVFATYNINPGLQAVFPWLSSLGQAYEEFQFDSLVFRYIPSCPTTTAGHLLMAFDPDVYDSAPVSAQEFGSHQCNVRSSVFQPCTFSIPKNLMQKWLYTRSGTVSGDQKTYDIGSLHLGYSQISAPTVLGMVEIEYSVRLKSPQPGSTVGATTVFNNSTNTPFNTVLVDTLGSLVKVEPALNKLTFNALGTYQILLDQFGTATSPTPSGTSGITTGVPISDTTNARYANIYTATVSNLLQTFILSLNASVASNKVSITKIA